MLVSEAIKTSKYVEFNGTIEVVNGVAFDKGNIGIKDLRLPINKYEIKTVRRYQLDIKIYKYLDKYLKFTVDMLAPNEIYIINDIEINDMTHVSIYEFTYDKMKYTKGSIKEIETKALVLIPKAKPKAKAKAK